MIMSNEINCKEIVISLPIYNLKHPESPKITKQVIYDNEEENEIEKKIVFYHLKYLRLLSTFPHFINKNIKKNFTKSLEYILKNDSGKYKLNELIRLSKNLKRFIKYKISERYKKDEILIKNIEENNNEEELNDSIISLKTNY